MNDSIHVAYSELVRASTEAVRGLGFPFGQADDAAPTLVWLQAVLGAGYPSLRLADGTRPVAGWGQARLSKSDDFCAVDLTGLPLFVYGTRVSDLAVALAQKANGARLLVRGALGGWAAQYIVSRVAAAGIDVMGTWQPGGNGADDAPAGSFVARGTRGSDPPGVYRRAFADETPSPVVSFVSELSLTLNQTSDKSARLDAPGEEISPDVLIERCIAVGMQVPPEDHAFLGSLCARLRVRASERSRNQAG